MKYPNAEYRAREAHTRAWAQNLGRHIGWTFTSQVAILPPVLRSGFCDPNAGLIVMGLGGELPRGLFHAVSEIRTAALLLQAGVAVTGSLTCYFSLLRCAEGKVHSHDGLRLWADRRRGFFLIPDPAGLDPLAPCFALDRRGIRPGDRPDTGVGETAHGLIRGAELLLLS